MKLKPEREVEMVEKALTTLCAWKPLRRFIMSWHTYATYCMLYFHETSAISFFPWTINHLKIVGSPRILIYLQKLLLKFSLDLSASLQVACLPLVRSWKAIARY